MKHLTFLILTLSISFTTFGQENNKDNIEFPILDKPATPQGGYGKFYSFLADNIKYPGKYSGSGVEGTVYVMFVVKADGSIDDNSVRAASKDEIRSNQPNEKILKEPDFINEAIRIIRLSPDWKPGKIKKEPHKQRIVFPIKFIEK